jgi:DNA-binding NarL/FixJ family response regulator
MARDGAVTRLGHLYGLTSAEIAVMGAIVSGFSIQEIADLRHVSVNTIRQQLKELLAKTGSHRQTDLVRLALSVPALADDGGC